MAHNVFQQHRSQDVIGVVDFKLRFTAAERQHINQLRGSNAVMGDFYSLLDDPRLTKLDLTAPAVVDGVTYTVAQLVTAGIVQPADEVTRVSQLLAAA